MGPPAGSPGRPLSTAPLAHRCPPLPDAAGHRYPPLPIADDRRAHRAKPAHQADRTATRPGAPPGSRHPPPQVPAPRHLPLHLASSPPSATYFPHEDCVFSKTTTPRHQSFTTNRSPHDKSTSSVTVKPAGTRTIQHLDGRRRTRPRSTALKHADDDAPARARNRVPPTWWWTGPGDAGPPPAFGDPQAASGSGEKLT